MRSSFSNPHSSSLVDDDQIVKKRFVRNNTFIHRRTTKRPIKPEIPQKTSSSVLSNTIGLHESLFCSISADGSVFVQAFEEGGIAIWRNDENGKYKEISKKWNDRPVRQVSLSADGNVAAASIRNGTICVVDTQTLDERFLLSQKSFEQAWGVALSADGTVLFASFAQEADLGRIVRFNLQNGEQTILWQGYFKVFDVFCTHDASRVMFFRQGGVVKILDALQKVRPHRIIYSFEYMKGSYHAAIDAFARSIAIVEFRSVVLHELMENGEHKSVFAKNVSVEWNSLRKCDITADGSRYIEMKKRSIVVRNSKDGSTIISLAHLSKLNSCCISANGAVVGAIDIDGKFITWHLDGFPLCDIEMLKHSEALLEDSNSETTLQNSISEANLEPPAPEVVPIEESIEPGIDTEDQSEGNDNTFEVESTYGRAIEQFEEILADDSPIPIESATKNMVSLIRSSSSRKTVPEDIESVISDALGNAAEGKDLVEKTEYASVAEAIDDQLEDVKIPAEWEAKFHDSAGSTSVLSLHQAVSALLEIWDSVQNESETRFIKKPSRLEMRKLCIKFDLDSDLLINKDEFLNTLKYILKPIKQ